MCFEIFGKLYKIEDFFPKFDMSVNANSNKEICLGSRDDVVDSFSMHVAKLV